ncbi:MAG: hypothetical protein QF467_07010, partial [SAR202 cluster bacterium]|nr:hypothetical protein [SAR202 cluster bacterium]
MSATENQIIHPTEMVGKPLARRALGPADDEPIEVCTQRAPVKSLPPLCYHTGESDTPAHLLFARGL